MSIQLSSPFRKTSFLRKFSIERSKRFAKTAAKDLFPEYLLMSLLVKRLLDVMLTNAVPSSLSIKFGLLLDEMRTFSKRFVNI